MDYIGVIIGQDLVVRDGVVTAQPGARSKMDKSIFGWKKMMKQDPQTSKTLITAIIRNTYRTLMTRGMKGCYAYIADPETEAYFRSKLVQK